MADNFDGLDSIVLRPGDSNVPYAFKVTVCSAASANNGAYPFGTSINSFTVMHHPHNSTASSTKLVSSKTLSSFVMQLNLSYHSTVAAGLHHLKFVTVGKQNAVSTAWKKRLDFERLNVVTG